MRLHLDEAAVSPIVGMLADAYAEAPATVGQFLTDLAVARLHHADTLADDENRPLPGIVRARAEEVVDTAMAAVVEACITELVTADLSRSEALVLADQLTAAARPNGAAA